MKNVSAKFVQGVSKKTGNPYEALQFEILTEAGIYKTNLIYPSPLEKGIIKKAISNVGAIYSGDTSPEFEGFGNEL